MALTTILLEDRFSDDRAAGSVNGTLSDSGHARDVIDSDGDKLWLAAGKLELRSLATPAFGNPIVRYPVALDRANFPTVISGFYQTGSGGLAFAGFFNTSSGAITASHVPNAAYLQPTSLLLYEKATKNITIPLVAGSQYKLAVVARPAGGAAYFVQGGIYANWTLVFLSATSTDATLYAGICALNSTANRSFDYLLASQGWMPSPLLSHGFGSALGTSDGLGHAETTGVGSGGSGMTLSNVGSTWSVSGGKAINTSPSTLAEKLALASLSTANVYAEVEITKATAEESGLAICWDSTTSPQNGIKATIVNGQLLIDKYLSGTPTNVSTVAVTYSAGAELTCSKIGSALRFYYNNAFVAAVTISDAAIVNNTLHGIFSTGGATNTLDNLVIHASGTSGEHNDGLTILFSMSAISEAISLTRSSVLRVAPVPIQHAISLARSSVLRIVPVPIQRAISVARSSVLRVLPQPIIESISITSELLLSVRAAAVERTVAITESLGDSRVGREILRIIRLLGRLG